MEQIYLVEIFVDKVSVFDNKENDNKTKDSSKKENTIKKLIVIVKFGPKMEFVIKEGALAKEEQIREMSETNDSGRSMKTRIIRSGRAYLFPSFPDTVIQILDRYPLEIAVWNNYEDELKEFIGIGTMFWDTEFYGMIRENTNACKFAKPLSIKQKIPLMDECCCSQVGSITLIVRLTPLGSSIFSTFQQMPSNNELFIFLADRSQSVYECKRIKPNDPNFITIQTYKKTINPEYTDESDIEKKVKKVVVCTPEESCKTENAPVNLCARPTNPLFIKMGQIKGPCGNVNCALAQKIKSYLRKTEVYRKIAATKYSSPDEPDKKKKICGQCGCHSDRWHRENCVDFDKDKVPYENMTTCPGCGGLTKKGDTCQDKKDNAPDKPVIVTESQVNPSIGKETKGINHAKSENDCVCKPPKEKPLCGAIDCVCREERVRNVTRKLHKPFCPAYRHKHTCPVANTKDESGHTTDSKDDDEKEENLPYGISPIKLTTCPVVGKPCTNPETLPVKISRNKDNLASDKGVVEKIRCSKEFERIKGFLDQLMMEEKRDLRCHDPLTLLPEEHRCCDKEYRSGRLEGKDCCGHHKVLGIPDRNPSTTQ